LIADSNGDTDFYKSTLNDYVLNLALGMDIDSAHELSFIDTIKNSGLKAFKGNITDFGSWKPITSDNFGHIIPNPCK
jgi:hypothetical protein